MAALFGRLYGERGAVTRQASRELTSKLETWEGSVKTVLFRDGTFEVWVGDKSDPKNRVFRGVIDA